MSLSLRVPGSKSMTQRGLILGALADGPTRVRGALDCEDSQRLTEVLRALGAELEWSQDEVEVQPRPLRSQGERLDCGNAGTALRFAAGLALITDGPLLLDGNARMRRRPVGGLVEALRRLGIEVRYHGTEGYPPIELQRRHPPAAEVDIDGSVSSQFTSGLLLAAPLLPAGLRVRMVGELVSRPYVGLTLAMMRRSGADFRWSDPRTIEVAPGGYGHAEIAVEPDWSTAAFLLAAEAVTGCSLQIPGLVPPEASLQGDSAYSELACELELGRPHQLDLTDTPDLIAPLAVLALSASHRTRLYGAAHTRVKESDRITVLCHELRKLGAVVQEREDGLEIEPLVSIPAGPIELDPAEDHRMAMAFGVLSLRVPGIRVRSPECVAKSFPKFWEALDAVRAACAEVEGIETGSVAAPRPLFGPALVGLRGSGKSTLAPLVARQTGLAWVDADAELERRTGKRIAEILQEAGEPEFRRLEREVMLELLRRPGSVLATGGGAVMHEEVRRELRDRVTVWLRAPAQVLATRIDGTGRPSLTGQGLEEEVLALASAREPLYREVTALEIDTARLEPKEAARRIAEFWASKQGDR
jgi:3-phosphoshikimate 1-carboxyvinyltransferase